MSATEGPYRRAPSGIVCPLFLRANKLWFQPTKMFSLHNKKIDSKHAISEFVFMKPGTSLTALRALFRVTVALLCENSRIMVGHDNHTAGLHLLHPFHLNACGKHIVTVESAIDDRTLETFPSEDDERISGPYTGYDKYGNVDHTYWQCEDCGAEATQKEAPTDCC
jgi:hypothetical protein